MESARLLENRKAGFCIIAIVYVIAGAIGVFAYNTLSYDPWLKLLVADVIATIVVFIFSCIFKNASVYDPYWSVQPPVILTFFAFSTQMTLIRFLLLLAVWCWGVRLTANWAYTFHGLHCQDWRYSMLHEKTGVFYSVINFLGIHLFPTLVVYACILPAVYAMIYDAQANIGTILFFFVSIGAVILQMTADRQMHAFRKEGSGGLIHTGLWKYSRHPNYLGEILMWWGVALSVVSVFPAYWYLCAGALANTLMFLIVSIPMADKRQSRKTGFTEYMNETRMLLPFKKGH